MKKARAAARNLLAGVKNVKKCAIPTPCFDVLSLVARNVPFSPTRFSIPDPVEEFARHFKKPPDQLGR